MKTSQIYLRFIQLVKNIESAQSLPILEPIELALLDVVSLKTIQQQRLSVKDLMGYSQIASPATMHKHIHAMIDKGWIFLVPTEDARRKQIVLTNAALKHFDRLGNAIIKAVK
jgi:DNA-binding MarR family transcriptional regulator